MKTREAVLLNPGSFFWLFFFYGLLQERVNPPWRREEKGKSETDLGRKRDEEGSGN